MLNFNKTIQTDHVILRVLKNEDFDKMKVLTKDRDQWYYFTADLSDEAVLKAWIEQGVNEWNEKKSLPFTLIHPETGQIMGSTRISNLSERDRRAEIGWTWMAKAFQGTGINRHVKQLLIKYLFEETDIFRIELKTDVLNLPARNAMLKAGFTEEGILRSHTQVTNNRRRDSIFYSILRDEWKGN